MTVEQVVEKTAHNPSVRYAIQERGYIREGYFADLVLVDPKASTLVDEENNLYQCAWSPFTGHEFSSQIKHTWINGTKVYSNSDSSLIQDTNHSPAMRLSFER